MKLYFKYLSILLKSQLQYRLSFLLICITQFLAPFIVFVGIYLIFKHFGQIKDWSFGEVALCFGIIHMSFSIAEGYARGFDNFSTIISNGEFDRILVRPRGIILQVLGSKFEFSRIGKVVQGIIVFIIAILNIHVEWNVFKVITIILMIISGVIIFTGIFMLGATLCFWTTQSLEIVNIFTDGGRTIAQYPLSIYKKWITKFFTYVIPFGCINYLPLMYILDRVHGNKILYMITPIYGMSFIIPCLFIWKVGVTKYASTGS